MDDSIIGNIRPHDIDRPTAGRRTRSCLVEDKRLARDCLSAVGIRKLVRIPVRIPIPIELPNRLLIRRHRIHRQEHTQLRIHVPLLHVTQPCGRIAHMPGVPRPVLDQPAQLGTIRLKPASLNNTSCAIRDSDRAAQCIHMHPGNTRRAAGGQQSTTYMDVLRGALASSLFMHHLPGQRIHRAQALPLGVVGHRTPPIAETNSPDLGRSISCN